MAWTRQDQPQQAGTTEPRPDVELRLPAESVYAAVVRTTAAGLAARLDFTIDDIEDLRIAMSEATALVIPTADPGSDIFCRFTFGPGAGLLTVEIEAETTDEPTLDPNGFAWQVLDTLAQDASARSGDGRFAIRFTVRSQLAPQMSGPDR